MRRGRIGRVLCGALLVAAVAVPAASARDARVAYARTRHVLVYASPNAKRPLRALPNPYHGTRLAFLVRRLRGRWARVLLPVRPNGSSGWVRRSQVRLLRNEYRVRIDLRRHRLSVWRGGRLALRQPVGVGRSETPTPAGLYYVVELIQTDDPHGPYGPYAFGLSAHSDVLRRFDGGDGQVGIHGTNEPQGLGTDVSHGCIRIGNGTIARLAKTLPLGTPVQIVGGARVSAPPRPGARHVPGTKADTPPVLAAAKVRPRPAENAASIRWGRLLGGYLLRLFALLHME
jgi:lipoprotein-anchoring transpeptidase ErfK/SrfK